MNVKSLLSGVLLTIAVVALLLVLSGCANRDLTNKEWSSISEYISKNGPLKQEDIQVD